MDDRPEGSTRGDEALGSFVAAVAAHTPTPAGGSAAAAVAAIGAALCEMAASFSKRELADADALATRARGARAEMLRLVDEDADAFEQLLSARRAAREGSEAADSSVLEQAEARLADVPLRLAREARELAEEALLLLERGRAALQGDAYAAVLLLEAAGRIAADLALINLEQSSGDVRRAEASALAESLESLRRRAIARLTS